MNVIVYSITHQLPEIADLCDFCKDFNDGSTTTLAQSPLCAREVSACGTRTDFLLGPLCVCLCVLVRVCVHVCSCVCVCVRVCACYTAGAVSKG